jgi:hypothetical protein
MDHYPDLSAQIKSLCDNIMSPPHNTSFYIFILFFLTKSNRNKISTCISTLFPKFFHKKKKKKQPQEKHPIPPLPQLKVPNVGIPTSPCINR